MSRFYWRVRWVFWDFREHLLVRLLSQKMSRNTTLYVHPRNGGPPGAVVRRLDDAGREIETDPYDHDHVEGRRKATR